MQMRTSSAWEFIYVMSDTILARVSETLSTEQSLESLVRQLLEMLEIVTDMESTYLTKVDISARLQHILYARNSKQMQIPEGLSVPWGDTLCKRALDSNAIFSNEVPVRWADCDAAKALGITTYASIPIYLADGSLYGTLCATSTQKKAAQRSRRAGAETVCRIDCPVHPERVPPFPVTGSQRGAYCALLHGCPHRVTQPSRNI